MIARNLLIDPYWEAKDLGKAIPKSPHAVSVALPRWEDVIAYEEKDPLCMKTLQSIYPRFGLNPLVAAISQKALMLYGKDKSSCWPYPNFLTAEKAKEYCGRINKKLKINHSGIVWTPLFSCG